MLKSLVAYRYAGSRCSETMHDLRDDTCNVVPQAIDSGRSRLRRPRPGKDLAELIARIWRTQVINQGNIDILCDNYYNNYSLNNYSEMDDSTKDPQMRLLTVHKDTLVHIVHMQSHRNCTSSPGSLCFVRRMCPERSSWTSHSPSKTDLDPNHSAPWRVFRKSCIAMSFDHQK